MFEVFKGQRRTATIDLASVRDTLLYIESDVSSAPDLTRLAGAIRSALNEIERLEASSAEIDKPEFAGARFLPARL